MNAPPLAVCLVYDRLYPASIGGAERWYRLLAERLVQQGHHVTYLTSTHWKATRAPTIPGVRIIPLCFQSDIYSRGRRRLLPTLSFAVAAGRHLFLHGGDYDVVHTSATLSTTALIAGWLAPVRGYRLILDWWEIWTRRYWQQYLGPIAGIAGWLIQRQVARLRHHPVAYSKLHAERLHQLRTGKDVPVLRGLLDESWSVAEAIPASPLVVSAGRLIPDKQVATIPAAVAIARERIPELRAAIIGAGPDAERVQQSIVAVGLDSVIELPGFVPDGELRDTLRCALCLVQLSRREGYGLVVVEAAALGTPSIVLRHPDSAASELISEGITGFLIESTDPWEVASAILRVYEGGQALRQQTLRWFHTHAEELTASRTVSQIVAHYRNDTPKGSSVR